MAQLWEVRTLEGSKLVYSFTEAMRLAFEAGSGTIYTEDGLPVASVNKDGSTLTDERRAA